MAKKNKDGIKVKGMFRINIEEDGRIVGDSGWVENQVTNLGFNQYLVMSLGSIAGSKYVTHLALGSGGAPAASATTLAGEVEKRQALTASSTVAGRSVVQMLL
jgi:type V secretory pathway adhesin AidA